MDRHETNPTTRARGTEFVDDARATGTAQRSGMRGLRHLDDLDDFKVADGEPDIRGWTVRTADNRKLGKVTDLLVDMDAMKVRYMEVDLDRKELSLKEDRRVLVPVGVARLNDDDDVVVVSRQAAELAGLPGYARGTAMTPAHERDLRDRYGAGAATAPSRAKDDLYGSEHFDDRSFFSRRRQGREDAEYLTRSEEELAVGKRNVQSGAVTAHKTVETEHVEQSVPVMRETASVERRPIRDGAARSGEIEVGEDEVRVPLMAEQVVTEKRVVPKEELVIRKQQVQGRETVEADLKRERIDVDGPVDREPRSASGTPAAGRSNTKRKR